MCKNISDAMS